MFLKDYHPDRVLTLAYQSLALATMVLFTYKESKINTRRRNISGYILFFLTTLALVLVNISIFCTFLPWIVDKHLHDYYILFCTVRFNYIRERGHSKLYCYMCFCCCFRSCGCSRSRWHGRRPIFDVPRVGPGNRLNCLFTTYLISLPMFSSSASN